MVGGELAPKNMVNLDLWGGFLGFLYPFQALGLLVRKPGLWRYLIIPVAINAMGAIALYTALLWFGLGITEQAIGGVKTWLTGALAGAAGVAILGGLVTVVGWILGVLALAIALLLTGIILLQFGVILGAPWYGQLSERLEKMRRGTVETVEVGLVRDLARALLFEVKKIVLVILLAIAFLVVGWVPVVGPLVSSLGGLVTAGTIVCLDFFDGPLERRRLSFRQKLAQVYGAFPGSGGFALVCLVLISVPLLNLVTIPLCVMAGTLFVCDRILPPPPTHPQGDRTR